MDLFEKCRQFTRAKEVMALGIYPYFHAIGSGAGAEVQINGRTLIMLGSNNYLGLTSHPKVKEAAIEATRRYGSGCTGSRFLNGTLALHEELEIRLAQFMKCDAALVFSTGFQTNQGTIATLVGKDDLVYADRQNHASIVDGCRLAFGRTYKFKHNDAEDLERLLKNTADKQVGKLLVVDGVFSMEGDIVNLPPMVELAQKYGVRVMVDDAHSIGVLGEGGRGTASHFGLTKEVDITMGTFSKSLASLGGFIVGDEPVIHYIKHHARAFIFSASPTPAAAASVIAALDILEQEPERVTNLWKNVNKMKKGFIDLGYNVGKSASAVIPLEIGDDLETFKFWRALFDNGVFTNTAISPAVEPGHALIRTSYMATQTGDILDRVLEIFARVGKEFGIIA
ncbi:pyridoxal phosphate-dependent aminotransferase family protein [candidate division KSB1 bacterium]|nr:pyridoxal phosphate-dependent aminotransferase family protein [candidate division KSB1 bacterium]